MQLSFLYFLFIKSLFHYIPIQITNNKEKNSTIQFNIFDFFYHKFFSPIKNVTFHKSVFVFWDSWIVNIQFLPKFMFLVIPIVLQIKSL